MSGKYKKNKKNKINYVQGKFTEDNPKFCKMVNYPQNMHNVLTTLKEQNNTFYNEVLFRVLLIGLKHFTQQEAVSIIHERDSIVDNFFIKDKLKKQELTDAEKAQKKKKELATMIWQVKR